MDEQEDEDLDVVVIGAGASGLIAARKLLADSGSLRVALVEARDRVGGRCFSDHGAGYVDAGHDRVRELCHEFGLPLYEVYDTGRCYIESLPGRVRHYRGTDIPSGQSIRTMLALGRIVNSIEVSTEALIRVDDLKGLSAELAELDEYSLLDYLRSRTADEEAIETLNLAVLPVFGAPASAISLLYFLFYCRSAGSLGRLLSVTNGAQAMRIGLGGFHELCKRLAAKLPAGVLRLDSPVLKLQHDGQAIKVLLQTGKRLHTRCVILALQPSLYERITFSPALPDEKMNLCRAFRCSSSYAKARLVYATPWWRELNCSGQLVSCKGPAAYFLDDVKPPGADPRTRYGLVAFICDRVAAEVWRNAPDAAARGSLLGQQLFGVFKDTRCTDIVDYAEFDWDVEEFTAGCVPCLTAGGHFKAFSRVSDACWDGTLQFAGTEASTVSCGYVDGAIRSGDRAASAALRSLGKSEKEAFAPPGQAAGTGRGQQAGSPGGDRPGPTRTPNSRGFVENFVFGRVISARALRDAASRRRLQLRTQTQGEPPVPAGSKT